MPPGDSTGACAAGRPRAGRLARATSLAGLLLPSGRRRLTLSEHSKNMDDPSDLPRITEPFFRTANATVDIMPCMDANDLQAGLQKIQ